MPYLLKIHPYKTDTKKPQTLDFSGKSLSLRLFSPNGVDGSRTRVQKPIPCPSTIVVRYPGRSYSGLFPPAADNERSA